MSIQATGRTSGWFGWIWFAAIVLVTVGVFNVIEGLAALFKDDSYFAVTGSGLLVFNLTSWGWIHLIVGLIQVFAGFYLFRGQVLARIVAVAITVLNAIAQLAFLSAYPVWAVIVIALDMLVIWAVVVHGDELEAAVRA